MDKNSKEFDQSLFKELVGKTFSTDQFESEINKIFRKKSNQKLWWSNIPVQIWDGKDYHDVNYRCCPESHSVRYIFGLVLEHDQNKHTVTVKEGYLEAL